MTSSKINFFNHGEWWWQNEIITALYWCYSISKIAMKENKMIEVAFIPACFYFPFTKWLPKRGMRDPCHVHNTFQAHSCCKKDNCCQTTLTYTWIKLHKILFGQLTLSYSRAASNKKPVTCKLAASQIWSAEERQFASHEGKHSFRLFNFQIMAPLSIDQDTSRVKYTSVYLALVTFVSGVTNVRKWPRFSFLRLRS